MSGIRERGSTLNYPDDSVQKLIAPSDANPWWVIDKTSKIVRGRLIWSFVPHVDQIPYQLVITGRSTDATIHNKATAEISTFNFNHYRKPVSLPVAAFPLYEGEAFIAVRAKKRPMIVLSTPGEPPNPALMRNKPGHLTAQMIIAAPFYGKDEGTGSRSGYTDAFVQRVKACEFPQFFWDKLPCKTGTEESILRFDHMQPVGFHHQNYKIEEYCLSENALELMDEWIGWYMHGRYMAGGLLDVARSVLSAGGTP